MRARRASILATAALAVASIVPAAPAAAQSSGTVGATVTVAGDGGACLTVGTSVVDFGTLSFSDSDPTYGISTPQYDITNCGVSSIDLHARGTDATGAPWSLQSTDDPCFEGPNVFALGALVPGEDFYRLLRTTDQRLGTLTAETVHSGVDHLLAMPCQGSDGAGQQVSFDIIYTAVPT